MTPIKRKLNEIAKILQIKNYCKMNKSLLIKTINRKIEEEFFSDIQFDYIKMDKCHISCIYKNKDESLTFMKDVKNRFTYAEMTIDDINEMINTLHLNGDYVKLAKYILKTYKIYASKYDSTLPILFVGKDETIAIAPRVDEDEDDF